MRKQLRISAWVLIVAAAGFAWSQATPAAAQHLICGIVHKVSGAKFALETRTGKVVQVDASAAVKAGRTAILSEGLAISAEGNLDKSGALQAETVVRIKSARTMWPEDR
jgi:hypothetical protein